jgi:UDP-GlcNAc:undecaprenyl-phosphate GlcNAc-1-phosphate transferase
MGDGGSQFLGFMLGASAVLLTQSDRAPLSPVLVLFIIGVPLLDLLAVTTQRLVTGGKPFQADQEHLHHKLLRLGFTHNQVVLVLYILQIGMVAAGYACRWSGDLLLGGLYMLLLSGVGTFYYGVYSGRLSPGLVGKWSAGVLYWRTNVHPRPWLSEICLYGLLAGIVGFFLLGVLLNVPTSAEISYLAMGLGVLVFGGLRKNVKTNILITRMGLYLGSTFILYSLERALLEAAPGLHLLFQGFIGLLIIALVLAIHLDKDKRFTPNPMDYLLLFLALVMPMLLKIQIGAVDLGAMMAKLIVLFFACEVLLQAFSTKVRQIGYFSGAVLLSLAVRGFW